MNKDKYVFAQLVAFLDNRKQGAWQDYVLFWQYP